MTGRDWLVLALEAALAAAVIGAVVSGGTEASFTKTISLAPLGWEYGAYWAFLLIPTAVEVKEELHWRRILASM